MKNFKVTSKEDNKEYWISRSVAVTAIVIYINEFGHRFILANKRGPGCPDYIGYWNLPCGYLDYDESTRQAASREVLEETGYIIDPSDFTLYGIQDIPHDGKQNVTIRYKVILTEKPRLTKAIGGEKDEVDEVKWIPLNEIYNYDWAFDHKEIIENL